MADAFGLTVVAIRRVEAQRAWKIDPTGVGLIERRSAKPDARVSDAVDSGIDAAIRGRHRIVKVFTHLNFRQLGRQQRRGTRNDKGEAVKNPAPHPSELAKSKGTVR